jgi:hypothetical protein
MDQLGNRHFSFYPPIINFEHNEWQFRRATWSEILVVNSSTGEEIWIPRRFVGEVSRINDPVLIVGLLKELEYKGGAVWPYQRRVIEMPIAVGERSRTAVPERAEPAPVIGIRLEPGTDSKIGRLIGGALLVGIVACFLVVTMHRGGLPRPRLVYTAKDQSYLELGPNDDYYSVVRKLGDAGSDRWKSESGDLQYRALSYPQRGYTVILMGTERNKTGYIGTLDDNWHPLHWVEFRTGGSTRSMLRELPRF